MRPTHHKWDWAAIQAGLEELSSILRPADPDEDLARRQREHLEHIARRLGGERSGQRCLHTGCSACIGTGVKADGSPCVHMLSCPCPRCSPHSLCAG